MSNLNITIITSKYGLRRVKTLPSNTAIAFVEEIYEDGFGPANLVQQKQDTPGIIRFETKKSEYPSGKYLNYTLVTERIIPIKNVQIKGIVNTNILLELESISYSLSKGVTIYGQENSFSGSVVFGRPVFVPKDKIQLSSISTKTNGKGVGLLNDIFNEVKGEIGFDLNESHSFSSAEDQITESATLEVRQNKYTNLKSLTGDIIASFGNFYKFSIESASFDGNGNILGSVIVSYKPKNSSANLTELKNLLEADIKKNSPPTKVLANLKTLKYNYQTNTQFYNIPISAQYSLDGASLNGTSTTTYTNAKNILTQGFISNVTEELVEQQIPKGKKLIVRGTVIGLENQSFSIANNKKFDKAKLGLDYVMQKYNVSTQDLNKHDTFKEIQIPGGKALLTNADINYGISDGAITFSLTAEQRDDIAEDKDFLYLNVSWLQPEPVHWANSFLIIGGEGGKGEELMQNSEQSRPLEYVLKFSAVMRKYDVPEVGFKKFEDVVLKNVKKILRSASCTYNYASRSFEGTAVFIEFDKYREIKDDKIKSSSPTKPK